MRNEYMPQNKLKRSFEKKLGQLFSASFGQKSQKQFIKLQKTQFVKVLQFISVEMKQCNLAFHFAIIIL